jgi:soluble lytic murein transglycosylase-like protein
MKALVFPTLLGLLAISIYMNLLQHQQTQRLEQQLYVSEYDARTTHHILDQQEEFLEVMTKQVMDAADIDSEFKARYYARAYIDAATDYRLDPRLLLLLTRVESGFDSHAKSNKGALGMMQIMPNVWMEKIDFISTDKDLTDPYLNIHAGAHVLRHYLNRAQGDMRLALLMYNRGEHAVRNAIVQGLDPSNGFARKVLHGQALRTRWDS